MYKGGRQGSGEGCNNAYSDKEAHQRVGWGCSSNMNAGEMQNGINVCKHGDLRNSSTYAVKVNRCPVAARMTLSSY